MTYVYMVRAGHKQYKVGITTNINKRVKALQTSNIYKIEVVTAFPSPEARAIEAAIHKQLSKYVGNGGREWFSLTPKQALDICVFIAKSPAVTMTDLDELKELIENQGSNNIVMVEKMESLLEQAKYELRLNNVEQKIIKPVAPEKPAKPTQEELDEKIIDEALRVFKENGKASTSLLQRRLRIGYSRAARIMDTLEKRGVISEADGALPRILLSDELSLKA